jgi:hypothetical protein
MTERWTRTLDTARVGARFLLGLPGWLRRPIDGATARAVVRARLAARETDFLTLVRRFVYRADRSPYRRLLQLAGCEYGDLERLVHQDGVEGALTTLFSHGVFLTVDELKGRRPAVRGSGRVHVEPVDLANPSAVLHFVAHSSGSGGVRTPVPLDLAFVREHAVNRRLSLEARGALAWRHAVCGIAGGAEMAIVLRFAVCGASPERWFTPVDPRMPGLQRRYRWTEHVMRWGSILGGVRLPVPHPVSPADPRPIVEWMRQALAAGTTPHLKTYTSLAVRVCRTAVDSGIDLAGARFTVVGEPLTAARHAAIMRSGAHPPATDYGSTETGQLGEPCVAPVAPDDVHVLDDLHALIQAGSPGRPHGLPPGALLVTSLRPTAPLILLNASMGDEAYLSTLSCRCPLESHGWRRHLQAIRSFEKLTSGGMTFFDTDVVRILDEVLPLRFGGAPTHYQLLEEEGAGGEPRLFLLVDPAVGDVDTSAVADAFLSALGDVSPGARVMEHAWRGLDVLTIIRATPRMTASGKILHLHRGALPTARGGSGGAHS